MLASIPPALPSSGYKNSQHWTVQKHQKSSPVRQPKLAAKWHSPALSAKEAGTPNKWRTLTHLGSGKDPLKSSHCFSQRRQSSPTTNPMWVPSTSCSTCRWPERNPPQPDHFPDTLGPSFLIQNGLHLLHFRSPFHQRPQHTLRSPIRSRVEGPPV